MSYSWYGANDLANIEPNFCNLLNVHSLNQNAFTSSSKPILRKAAFGSPIFVGFNLMPVSDFIGFGTHVEKMPNKA
jgi:hypothetical protein